MSTVPPRQVDLLEDMARARFGGLGQAEVELLQAAPRGGMPWVREGGKRKNPRHKNRAVATCYPLERYVSVAGGMRAQHGSLGS